MTNNPTEVRYGLRRRIMEQSSATRSDKSKTVMGMTQEQSIDLIEVHFRSDRTLVTVHSAK